MTAPGEPIRPAEVATTLHSVAQNITRQDITKSVSGGHKYVYEKGSKDRANLSEITKMVKTALSETTDNSIRTTIVRSYQVITDKFAEKSVWAKIQLFWMKHISGSLKEAGISSKLDNKGNICEGLFDDNNNLIAGKKTSPTTKEIWEGTFDNDGNLIEGKKTSPKTGEIWEGKFGKVEVTSQGEIEKEVDYEGLYIDEDPVASVGAESNATESKHDLIDGIYTDKAGKRYTVKI